MRFAIILVLVLVVFSIFVNCEKAAGTGKLAKDASRPNLAALTRKVGGRRLGKLGRECQKECRKKLGASKITDEYNLQLKQCRATCVENKRKQTTPKKSQS
ncbi:unnamed protein product [Adineta ricciae]|uniref:Uncharacterized protein n=1 Tax=Adineta ricciae TaxID=249248 RepID=A0A814GW18_ADIRI|nr:unnamed protein product [Adineta ricciae]CAF1443284.1 unnamed protein product [Adineta ricciae]